VAHLRYGEKVYSPLIEVGTAEIEVAFEMLESLRYLPYLSKKSKVIVNTQKILPAPVSIGVETYPDDIIGRLRDKGLEVFPVDAFATAQSLGETRAVNMVLVGALSCFLPVEEEIFLKVIDERIPERIRKVNREAYLKGREIIRQIRTL
jgi:indolepyruvate ferredoxin oxidoreductase beta subunit